MTSPFSIFPLLRQAAPRLSRHFFAGCRECAQNQPRVARFHTAPSNPRIQYKSKAPTPFAKAFRSQSTATATEEGSAPIARLAERIRSRQKTKPNVSSFPTTSKPIVGWWLFGSAASVFGIVVFGGLTRLTESGYAPPRLHLFLV